MIMILFLHSFHSPSGITFRDINATNFFDFFMESICMPSVDAFILISGYFSLRWRLKRFLSLVFQCYFFVIILYLILTLLGLRVFSIKDIILCGNALHNYWFVASYIGLYLFSPILNSFINENNPQNILKVVVIVFAWQTYYTLFHPDGVFGLGYSTMLFCNLYILGGYIRKADLVIRIKCKQIEVALLYLILSFIVTIAVLVYICVSHQSTIVGPLWCYSNCNPLIILSSVSLFIFFSRIKYSNKFVNYIGVSVLSVYLLHLHPAIRDYYFSFTEGLYKYGVVKHYSTLFILFFVIFLVSVFLDKIQIALYNSLCNIFIKFCDRWK